MKRPSSTPRNTSSQCVGSNRIEEHRVNWWRHLRPRPKHARRTRHGLSRYIVTPRVSKHRLFALV